MPAQSEAQRRAAFAALAAKREGRVKQLKSGAAKQMAQGMSEEQLQHFTHKKKGAPDKKGT
jgi:hypothetical protein